jgi:hypothetical protein
MNAMKAISAWWVWFSLLSFGLLLFVGTVIMTAIPGALPMSDFWVYFHAMTKMSHGISPYCYCNPIVLQNYSYPPLVAELGMPMGFLACHIPTYRLGRVNCFGSTMWVIFQVGFFMAGIWLLLKIVYAKVTPNLMLIACCVSGLFIPVEINLVVGQIDMYLFFMFCLIIYLYLSKKDFLLGIALPFLVFVKLSPVLLCFYFAARRRWEPIFWFFVSTLFVAVLGSIPYPHTVWLYWAFKILPVEAATVIPIFPNLSPGTFLMLLNSQNVIPAQLEGVITKIFFGALIGVAFWMIPNFMLSKENKAFDTLGILCLSAISAITAPVVWVFDLMFSLLFLLPAIMGALGKTMQRIALILFVVLDLVAAVVYTTTLRYDIVINGLASRSVELIASGLAKSWLNIALVVFDTAVILSYILSLLFLLLRYNVRGYTLDKNLPASTTQAG